MSLEEPAIDQRPTCSIGRFTFYKPTLGRWMVTLLLVGMCIGLGLWQVKRLEWKEGLIAELEHAQRSERVTTAGLPDDLAALREKNFWPITIEGEFRHGQEIHVVGRSIGGEPGFNVYTPLRLADGRMVLVNRGWVPQSAKAPQDRSQDPLPAGNVTVSGFISVPQGGSRFLPDHDVAGNLWFWPDITRINAEKGLQLPPFTVERVNARPMPDTLPLPRRDYQVELRNDHLNYALMWFSLSLAGLAIFIIYHFKSVKGDEGPDAQAKP